MKDNGFRVTTLAASLNVNTGDKLITMQSRFPRFILAEVNTHRALSKGAGSSRAIPVKRVLAQVWNDPAMPVHWGVNRAGMQAKEELQGWRRAAAIALWRTAGRVMCGFAWGMMKIGLHKQVANRILEAWQWTNHVISGTEWDNVFELRDHPDAQPEFQVLAKMWRKEVENAYYRPLQPGEWHMPYILDNEWWAYPLDLRLKLSAARSARVSYEPFDGDPSIQKEQARFNLLVGSRPRHSSPTEHQAVAMHASGFYANYKGFQQLRYYIENEIKVPGPSLEPKDDTRPRR